MANKQDKFGNLWLKLSEAKENQQVWLDEDFTCRCAGPATLCKDSHGLFFYCYGPYGEESAEMIEHHYIDGQADDGEHCVGIYTSPPDYSNA